MRLEMMSRIVKGYRDRIQRGGGSVAVSGAGTPVLTLTTATPSIGANQFAINDNTASGPRTIVWSGRGRFDFVNQDGSGYATVYAGSQVLSGTLAVSGTGTHQFSGPVRLDRTTGNNRLLLAVSGADKAALNLETTSNDTVFMTGANAGTEALRIVNANGYVSVATRLGIGTAAPTVPLSVVGSGYFSSCVGIGSNVGSTTTGFLTVSANGATTIMGRFEQLAANATAPVVVVKGGATPGAGGDLQQWQDSGGGTVAKIDKSGNLYAALVQLPNNAVASNPSANTVYLWWDEAAGALKIRNSAGTIKTLQAA